MAGPGILGPSYDYTGTGTPIGEHDSSTSLGYDPGGWDTYLWYTFTPEHTGVVSIDLYLTTAAGSTDQAGVEAYSDTLYQDAPGWRYITEEYGGPDQDLARYFGLVTAGVPVTFNVYGYLYDGAIGDYLPADVRVRVSDVLDPGDAPWEQGTPVTRDFTDSNAGLPARVGVTYDTPTNTADIRNNGGIRRQNWGGQVSNAGGSRDAVGAALRVARLGYYDSGTYPTEELRTDSFSASGNAVIMGWSVDQRVGGAVTAYTEHAAVSLSPALMAGWASSYLGGELGFLPAPPDENTLLLPGGFTDGVTITGLEFAPDTYALATTSAEDRAAKNGAMKWVIVTAKPVSAAPNRWGPTATGNQDTYIVANPDGPESLLDQPEAQVITWDGVSQAPLTPVAPALLDAFRSPSADSPNGETLLLVGTTEALLSDANPAPDPWPYDWGQTSASILTYSADYPGSTVHLLVTYARQWRPVPKPPLWTDDAAPRSYTRLYPREDGLGLSSGRRTYPPPRSRRTVGGIL